MPTTNQEKDKIKSAKTDLEHALVSTTAAQFSLASVKHSGVKDANKLRAKTKILIHKLEKDTK
jgi:hypothetical protein